MPFKDDTDFPDTLVFHSFAPARGGPGGARKRPPAVVERLGARPALSPATRPQQVTPRTSKTLALAVADLSETASRLSNKFSAKGRIIFGPKASPSGRRDSQAISEAVAKLSAQAATRVQRSPAKAIAADRRLFNPTPGPKTLFGTPAQIAPSSAARFRFAFPAVSAPCVARRTRKEVLFAKKHAGGASSRRPKKFGPYSHLGC